MRYLVLCVVVFSLLLVSVEALYWEDLGGVVLVNNSVDSYYFDKVSWQQFSNNFGDYWSRNTLYGGFLTDKWHYKGFDDASNVSFSIDSDNSSYFNATAWFDWAVSYGGELYSVRVFVRYSLEEGDENLTVGGRVLNTGQDIPVPVGFAWKINETKIGDNVSNDYVLINGSFVPLNTTFSYQGRLDNNMLYYWDNVTYENLWLSWNPSINYLVNVTGDRGILAINVGLLGSGEYKEVELHWLDATAAPPYWDVEPVDNPDPVMAGYDIEWSGTAIDPNDNPYKLYACKTNFIHGNHPAASYGGCGGDAATYCVSDTENSGVEASCNYSTSYPEVGTLTAYLFACDSTGRCNETTVVVQTTVEINYGWLNVAIEKPDNNSYYLSGDANLTVQANVSCEGTVEAICGTVYATARYNLSSDSPDTFINSSVGDVPFFLNPYDLSHYNVSGVSLSVSSQGATPTGMSWKKTDETRLYHSDYTNGVFQRECSVGGDITSCVYNGDKLPASPAKYYYGGGFTPDGSKYLFAAPNEDLLIQHNCSEAWNISSCSYGCNISSSDDIPTDIKFWDSIILVEQGYTYTTQYECVDSYSICGGCSEVANATYPEITQGTSWESAPNNMVTFISDDGSDKVYQLGCSEEKNVSSCNITQDKSMIDTRVTHITFSNDGDRMHTIGFNLDKVLEYELNTTQYKVLAVNESWVFNWSFNITTVINSSFYLDSLFVSSYSPVNIVDNDTSDRLIHINYSAPAPNNCTPVVGVDFDIDWVCTLDGVDVVVRNLVCRESCFLYVVDSNFSFYNSSVKGFFAVDSASRIGRASGD